MSSIEKSMFVVKYSRNGDDRFWRLDKCRWLVADKGMFLRKDGPAWMESLIALRELSGTC